MKNSGYYQMPRWLLESQVIRNEYEENALVRLYSRAKYEDEWVMHKGHKILLKRGDVATAPGEFIKQLRGNYWTKDKMDTFWKRLEREGWIKIKTIPSVTTIISITHYVGVEKRLGVDLVDATVTTRENAGMEGGSGNKRLGTDSEKTRNIPIYNKRINKEDNNSYEDSSSQSETDEQSESSILGEEEKTGSNSKKAKRSDSSPKVKKASSAELVSYFYSKYQDKTGSSYPAAIALDRKKMNILLENVNDDLGKAKATIDAFFENGWINKINRFEVKLLTSENVLPRLIIEANEKRNQIDNSSIAFDVREAIKKQLAALNGKNYQKECENHDEPI